MTGERPGSALFTAATMTAVLGTVFELAVLTHDGASRNGFLLTAVVGAWLFVATAWAGVVKLWLALVVGFRGEHRLLEAFRRWADASTASRGSDEDLDRMALVVGLPLTALFALALVAVAGKPALQLVRDKTLAAIAMLAIGVGALVAAALVAFAFGRALAAVLGLVPGRFRPSAVNVLRVSAWLFAASAIGATAWGWSWLSRGGLLAYVAALYALFFFGLFFLARTTVPMGGPAIATVTGAALFAFVAGSSSVDARIVLAQHGLVANRAQAALLALADFDGDGLAAVPIGSDCSPFDAAAHPLAVEIPGNGVDEDCDGSDAAAPGLGSSAPLRLPRPTPEAPDLVLVTLDAIRTDHVGLYGYRTRPTTPELDRLSARALVFERAFSADSGTGPSLWSLMTGKTPFQVDLRQAHLFPPVIGPEEHLLAKELRREGYSTSAALCGSMFAAPHWNLRDGFDRYEEMCGSQIGPLAERTASRALTELARLQRLDAPYFLWVHFFDAHDPYIDHADLDWGTRPVDRYDEELRYLDRHLARFLAAALRGRGRPTFVFVTADHGEGFGEHGPAPHARTLYREVTRVPLLVFGPGVRPRRTRDLVSSSDLFPTLLHLAGATIPAGTTMHTFVPALEGDALDAQRHVYQENSWSTPRRHVKAVIEGRYQLIRDYTRDTVELYDFEADPEERRNLAGQFPDLEAELRRSVEAFARTTTVPEPLR